MRTRAQLVAAALVVLGCAAPAEPAATEVGPVERPADPVEREVDDPVSAAPATARPLEFAGLEIGVVAASAVEASSVPGYDAVAGVVADGRWTMLGSSSGHDAVVVYRSPAWCGELPRVEIRDGSFDRFELAIFNPVGGCGEEPFHAAIALTYEVGYDDRDLVPVIDPTN